MVQIRESGLLLWDVAAPAAKSMGLLLREVLGAHALT